MIKTNAVVRIDTESVKVGDIYRIKYPDMVAVNVLIMAVTPEYLKLLDLDNPCVEGRISAKEISKCSITKMKLVEDTPIISQAEPVSTQYRVKPDKKCAADYIPKVSTMTTDQIESLTKKIIEMTGLPPVVLGGGK